VLQDTNGRKPKIILLFGTCQFLHYSANIFDEWSHG
jgi:hypothetical protein